MHIFDQDAYIFTSNSSMKYDLIIADRPDPVGAGKSLFKLKFYKNIKNLLKADGIAIFQSGVTFLQKKEIKEVIIKIKSVFENSGIILTVVPSYIGGHMALVWASKKIRIGKLKKNKSLKRIKTDYFNLQISEASLSLPNFIKTIQKF